MAVTLLALLGCGGAKRAAVADIPTPTPGPAPEEACAGLAQVPPLPMALLDEQISLDLPRGTFSSAQIGGTGVPLSILERPLGGGERVVFWATRFPVRLGDPLDPREIAAPYVERWPDAQALPVGDGWGIELDADYPMPEPWTDLERVLEYTTAGPGENLWTLAVFVSRGLATAEPESCRAAAERWAGTAATTDAVYPVEGPVCLTGASGATSVSWTAPEGEGWHRVRRVDRVHRTTYDELERWPLQSSARSRATIRLGPAASRSGEPDVRSGTLAGLPATWSVAEAGPPPDDVLRSWAEVPYGPDVLAVSLSADDMAQLERDQRAFAYLALNNLPCGP
jgi:hypothetical protein